MQVAVARQMYIAKNQADTDPALARLAQFTQRIIDVSRTPDGKSGSHVLAYADKDGATETNALFGTPDEINSKLDAIRNAGADYVLLVVSGGVDQLQRFKRDIMPNFSTLPTATHHSEGGGR
jgi:alkanesulfonate monooxygenase SsuD/methylene tetrahydromethanopterin reductase-like flavin-dependent oxidoreductase (luciferase family)